MNIGRNIKILRRSKGLLQKELGEALGISRVAISNYELEERTPAVDIAAKIADYFNITLDELVNTELKAPAEPVTFMEAINSGKKICSEHWSKDKYLETSMVFKELYEYTKDAALEFINGKWYIEQE